MLVLIHRPGMNLSLGERSMSSDAGTPLTITVSKRTDIEFSSQLIGRQFADLVPSFVDWEKCVECCFTEVAGVIETAIAIQPGDRFHLGIR